MQAFTIIYHSTIILHRNFFAQVSNVLSINASIAQHVTWQQLIPSFSLHDREMLEPIVAPIDDEKSKRPGKWKDPRCRIYMEMMRRL